MSLKEKVIFVIYILLFASCAIVWTDSDADWSILLGSYHLPKGDHCEYNPGVGYTWGNGVTAMVYKNSYCDPGALLSKSQPFFLPNTHWSYGAAVGYEESPVLPFVSITVDITEHGFFGVVPGGLIGKETIFFYGLKL